MFTTIKSSDGERLAARLGFLGPPPFGCESPGF